MNWSEIESKGIKSYYKDEWAFIIHGDCRDYLPLLPKVDLVLTDPPYNISNGDDIVRDWRPSNITKDFGEDDDIWRQDRSRQGLLGTHQ